MDPNVPGIPAEWYPEYDALGEPVPTMSVLETMMAAATTATVVEAAVPV